MRNETISERGFTVLELLISLAIAALLASAMSGLVNTVLETSTDTEMRNDALRDSRFAMQRMVTAVLGTKRLLLPLADNPNTNWRENLREQTVPASAPEGDSTEASAVLAVTLDPSLDIDADGWADANNDKDYLDLNNNNSRDADEPERVDEDLGHDNHNDDAIGIVGVDDDGDGLADEAGTANDDDEDGAINEDGLGNGDEDNDGSTDEDMSFDVSNDNAPGLIGIDDDFDGVVDEGFNDDDDEDGLIGEDWFDPVVFFLNGSTLMERRPNLNPADGTDFTEYPIADNVTYFRVERIPGTDKRSVLVDITLGLALPDSRPVKLNTRIRVGGGS